MSACEIFVGEVYFICVPVLFVLLFCFILLVCVLVCSGGGAKAESTARGECSCLHLILLLYLSGVASCLLYALCCLFVCVVCFLLSVVCLSVVNWLPKQKVLFVVNIFYAEVVFYN